MKPKESQTAISKAVPEVNKLYAKTELAIKALIRQRDKDIESVCKKHGLTSYYVKTIACKLDEV